MDLGLEVKLGDMIVKSSSNTEHLRLLIGCDVKLMRTSLVDNLANRNSK